MKSPQGSCGFFVDTYSLPKQGPLIQWALRFFDQNPARESESKVANMIKP